MSRGWVSWVVRLTLHRRQEGANLLPHYYEHDQAVPKELCEC